MGLEVSPGRPISRLVVGALSGQVRQQSSRRSPYVPPAVAASDTALGLAGAASSETVVRCTELLKAMLTNEAADLGPWERWISPDVVVWSPMCFASSRAELMLGLHDADGGDDTLTEVVIDVVDVDVTEHRVHLEWRLAARFSRPCFIDDDLLVEPTGRLVETAGVLVATFVDDLLVAAHCYYDDLALLEQLVSAV